MSEEMPVQRETGFFSLTDTECALLPSDEDVTFYAEHGWYLSKRIFDNDDLNLLRTASDEFYAGRRDRQLPNHPARLAYWTPEQGQVLRHNDYIHYERDDIGRLLRKPILGAIAARLARANEIRIFQSTLIYKPPRLDEISNIVPWHFDRDYWATSTSERMLTAFIPFHACDKRMGTITMIDGSHLWRQPSQASLTAQHFAELGCDSDGTLRRIAAFNDAQIREVPIEIPAGHISFHHCRIYHGSGPNLSAAPRRAISLHLQDEENSYREFRLGDGRLAAYNHDDLVRRTVDGKPDYADPQFCPVVWSGRPHRVPG